MIVRLRICSHRSCAMSLPVLMVLLSPPGAAAAQQHVGHHHRLRPQEPELVRAIEDGIARAATFRRLVATIAASDGIVYVSPGRCPAGARACLRLDVTRTATDRLLFVTVDVHRAGDRLVPSIAHELQHAVELLANPLNVDGASVQAHFRRIGYVVRPSNQFETNTAIAAELEVRAELRSSRSGHDAERVWAIGRVSEKNGGMITLEGHGDR